MKWQEILYIDIDNLSLFPTAKDFSK